MACDKAQSLVLRYCDTSFGWYTNRQSVVVRYDPDPEEAPHVTLQSPDTIFVNDDDDAHAGTNDFENAAFDPSVDDDDIVPVVVGFKSVSQPTNGTLRLSAQGLRIWENQNHVGPSADVVTLYNCQTPFERTLYVERSGLAHSTVNGCSLSLEWMERAGSSLGLSNRQITACEPVAEPICNKIFTHEGTNYVINPCCIVKGGRDAWFEVGVSPVDYPDSQIVWECSEPGVQFVCGNTGRRVCLRAKPNCPLGVTVALTIRFGDCPSNTPMFYAMTTGLVGIRLYHQQLIGRGVGPVNYWMDGEIEMLDAVYSQVGVYFRHTYLPPKIAGDDAEIHYYGPRMNRGHLSSHVDNADGITIFYVQSISDKVQGFANGELQHYVALSPMRRVTVLSHEIGHVLGLYDIYRDNSDRPKLPYVGTAPVPASFCETCTCLEDWNNGSGSRFYAKPALHRDVITRLLMFGLGRDVKVDIPISAIFGVTYSDTYMNSLTNDYAPVGWHNCNLKLDVYGTE